MKITDCNSDNRATTVAAVVVKGSSSNIEEKKINPFIQVRKSKLQSTNLDNKPQDY